ncbi:MAG: V-type ATPase subunit [Spirochaetaceae bacterium]|nr:V-type ATPase subunit [Spirochaetaceae bacterium]
MRASYDPSYAYARICGSIANAYIGKKALTLIHNAHVGDAWRVLFGQQPPALPEAVLLLAAQSETKVRALNDFRELSAGLEREVPFFAALLRKPEFAYVKSLAAAIVEGLISPPARTDPGASSEVSSERYPDLDRMFGGTRFDWIAREGLGDLTALKNRVDRQYYEELWLSLDSLPRSRSERLRALIAREAEIENLVWALRLRRYYALSKDEIEGLLIRLPGRDVASSALHALDLRPDLRSDWEGWAWDRFLRGARTGAEGEWFLDVRGIEGAARRYVFRLIRRNLHLDPFGYTPLYAFYRIKEIESAAVNGILEGIRMQAPAAEIAAFALDATGGAA